MRRPPAPLRAPARDSRVLALVLLAILFLFGAGLRLSHLDRRARTPDETFYTTLAAKMVQSGPGFMSDYVRAFNERPAEVAYPWPQRIGYFWLVSGSMSLTGNTGIEVPVVLSCLASVLALALLGGIALSLGGPWTAVATLGFAVASPLDLALAQRAWQDSILSALTLVMLLAFLRFARHADRARWAIAFFAVAGFALLVKESAIIPFGLGSVAIVLACRRARTG